MSRFLDWFDATPAETAALAVLLAGSVAAACVLWWTSAPRAADEPLPAPVPTAAPTVAAPVTVHVAGAVARPGVLELPAGSRIADAVDAAGGALPDAHLDALNLARELTDGEQVIVPLPGEELPEPAAGSGAAGGKVDLNRASAAEFEELPGIGPVMAERIVSHREEHGPFQDIEQLLDVRGIGPRTFESLRDHVTV